ncbi:MAG: hypothetical protein K8T91_26695 [Planctomycetes bacterium]|nr:hypothetical protein [Planctomycetota bacterium]
MVDSDVLNTLLAEMREMKYQLAAAIKPKAKRSIWTPSQVCHELGLRDIETIRSWCKEGRIEARKNATDGWEISNDMVEALKSRGGKPFPKGTYDNIR